MLFNVQQIAYVSLNGCVISRRD